MNRAIRCFVLLPWLLFTPISGVEATTSVTLANGLEVIAEEMRVSPLVAVSVVYRVGSRNEVTGKTGVSHFVEHMLFNGTERYPGDTSSKEILKNGGLFTGETWWDYTHFGEVVPSEKIDLALDIEADRMANAAVDSQGVEDERDIILEELAMRGEAPIIVLIEDLFATAFKIHPYHHWYPGGYFNDVVNIRPEYVRDFYHRYYNPSNAVVTVVGNIDEAEAIERVREYFEPIESRPEPAPALPDEPEQKGLRRVMVRGDANESRIMVFFKGPEYASRDFEAGTVLSTILGSGRSSILTKRLVETGMATDVAFFLIPTTDPFGFWLLASVEKDKDIKTCEKAIYDAIEHLKATPPDAETVTRTKTRIQGLTILGRQTAKARAFELATCAARGDWRYADQFLENIRSVTPQEVLQVARRYLDWERATIGWLIPNDSRITDEDLIGKSDLALPFCGLMGESMPGTPGLAMTFADALYEELPTGITLILKEDHSLPVVAVKAHVVAGSAYEPEGKSGLARLTAKTVAMGSRDYPYEYLYERVESLGSSISVDSDMERAYISASVLAPHAHEACRMVCGLLTSPSFRSKDFSRAKRELLSEISRIEEDAKELGLRRFREYYYADHPYSKPISGVRSKLKGLSLRDVKSFCDRLWVPKHTAIAVVGDFETEDMKETLRTLLSGWDRKAKASVVIPEVEVKPGFSRTVETLPDKRQIKVFWGVQGPGIKHPDFAAFHVMNFILGGGAFGSRLFDRIREKESLAYVVHSDMDLTSEAGAYYIHLGTRPRNIEEAIGAVREEVEKIAADGVTDEEMDLSKNFLKSILPFQMQTYSEIAGFLLDIRFFDLPKDHYDTHADRIEKVTKDDVLRAARTYLNLDNSCMVILGAVDQDLRPVRPTSAGN
jgi:zinc protease